MPIGNDVVDLKDPESQPEGLHPRWDQRAFLPRELQLLGDAASPHRMRWLLWAAKESAFKAASSLQSSVRFLPKAFAVALHDDQSAEVEHASNTFRIEFESNSDWIHAVARVAGGAQPFTRLQELRAVPQKGRVAETLFSRASAQVREMARAALGPQLKVERSLIHISQDGCAPVASLGGKRLPVHLSLSHHGRFVACAWTHEVIPAL